MKYKAVRSGVTIAMQPKMIVVVKISLVHIPWMRSGMSLIIVVGDSNSRSNNEKKLFIENQRISNETMEMTEFETNALNVTPRDVSMMIATRTTNMAAMSP